MIEEPTTRLATIDEAGTPPRSVIQTPKHAHAIKRQMISADIGRARQRAILKQNYDGHPPYDPSELKKRGLADMTNVNFKRLKALTDTNVDSYLDAQFEVPNMTSVSIDYGMGTQGHNFSQIVTDEFNDLLRRWRMFYSVMSKSNFNRIFYGSGMLYFEDDVNWRPQPAETGQVLVDKDADTNLDNLDIVCIRRTWRLHQLYRKIEDEDVATRLGWDLKATRKAIIQAADNNQSTSTYSIKLWETWNNRIKANDLYMSFVSPPIDCYDLLAKEYDGTISRWQLTDYDSDENLYRSDKPVAQRFDQVIQPFFLTEQESLWHNIRGYAAQLYNILKVLDKVDGRILDMTFIGASLVIKPTTEVARDKLNTLNLGPVTVLPAGVDYVTTAFPNLSQGPIITHNMLMQTFQQTSGEYMAAQQSTQTGEAPTATQNNNDLQTLARLSSSLMNHFYNNLDGLYKEMFRRAVNPNLPDESTPAGKSEWCKEARRFQSRLLDRGVPRGALCGDYLQSVEAVRAMGQGSASSRDQKANELTSMLSLMPNSQSRMTAISDIFTAKFGSKTARRYFPALPGKLLVNTAKLAELENAAMLTGYSVDVMDYEDAVTHLGIHMPMLMNTTQSLVQASGQQGQPPNMAAIQKVYSLLVVALPHCSAHLQTIAGDPTLKQAVNVTVAALKKLDSTAVHLQFQLKTAATAQQRAQIQASQSAIENAAHMQLEAAKLQLANRKQAHKENVDSIEMAIRLKEATQNFDVQHIQASIALSNAIVQNNAALNASNEGAPPAAAAPVASAAPQPGPNEQ